MNRCATHPVYEADYCPRCGTATAIPQTVRCDSCGSRDRVAGNPSDGYLCGPCRDDDGTPAF